MQNNSPLSNSILGFLKPVPVATTNTLRLLQVLCANQRRIGGKTITFSHRRYEIAEILREIEQLSKEGSIRTMNVAQLPRHFREASPFFIRALGPVRFECDINLLKLIATDVAPPLVARKLYFLPEHQEHVEQLAAAHLEQCAKRGGRKLSPLVAVLRLADFLATHHETIRTELRPISHTCFWVRPHVDPPSRKSRYPVVHLPVSQKFSIDGVPLEHAWDAPDLTELFAERHKKGIVLSMLAPSTEKRVVAALIDAASKSILDKVKVLSEVIDPCLKALREFREEVHMVI